MDIYSILNDDDKKNKILKIVFFAFIIIIIGYLVYKYGFSDDENNVVNQHQTNQPENYVDTDSTVFVKDPGGDYNEINKELVIPNENGVSDSSSSNNLGINDYMKNRQQSVDRMRSRQSYNSSPPIKRRSLPTTPSTPTIRTSTITRRELPPSNNIASNNNVIPTSSKTTIVPTEKPKTAEEKLQEAIAQKYENNNSSNSIEVLATIHNNQTITSSNAQVRLRLKENLYVNNTTIGTDAFVYAIAKYNGSTLDLDVTNISYKGKNYRVNLTAYDYRTGQKGILINEDNIIGEIDDRAKSEAQQEIRSYGRVGSAVSSILSGKNKKAKITLNDEHWLYLKSK